MYIEFKLPMGASGQAAAWASQQLNRELHAWSDRYKIPYNTKIVKYTKRITFDQDKLYEFFALTWNPTMHHKFWTDYRIVRDLNNKT